MNNIPTLQPLTVKTFYCNPFRECTYILHNAHDAIIIDAGCQEDKEKKRIAEYIEKKQLTLHAHLLTHAHLDHIMGARFIYDTYGVLPHLMSADDWYFSRQQEQATAFGCMLKDEPVQEYIPIEGGEVLHFGAITFQVLATPGHTQGGVCYLVRQSPALLFSGDTLFFEGVGRCDLPGGDYATLIRSIQKQLLVLSDDTIVYPGHGYETNIGHERVSNPYL